jgi:putative acetyltransferase
MAQGATEADRMTAPPILILRPIRRADDAAVAAIIRDVMTEFRCTSEGFAIHDPEVQAMTATYSAPEARYFVVEREGTVLGGGGFGRLAGSKPAEAICELRKMYFRPAARGIGAGAALLDLLLAEMRECGYRRCYLETTSWMEAAQKLYQQKGFKPAAGPMGCTGHHGCNRFFVRDL